MNELILGMMGFILAMALFELGRYRGNGEGEDGPDGYLVREELSEEEKRERERLIKDINAVFNYKGRKGGRA